MTLQGNQGRLTHAYERAQLSLPYPFPLPQYKDALPDMLPQGQVPSNKVEIECRKNCPE